MSEEGVAGEGLFACLGSEFVRCKGNARREGYLPAGQGCEGALKCQKEGPKHEKEIQKLSLARRNHHQTAKLSYKERGK